MPEHFVSASCRGERCAICGRDAAHKVGEEIPHDDPNPVRHNLTAYVCCLHFSMFLLRAAWKASCGSAAQQPPSRPGGESEL